MRRFVLFYVSLFVMLYHCSLLADTIIAERLSSSDVYNLPIIRFRTQSYANAMRNLQRQKKKQLQMCQFNIF